MALLGYKSNRTGIGYIAYVTLGFFPSLVPEVVVNPRKRPIYERLGEICYEQAYSSPKQAEGGCDMDWGVGGPSRGGGSGPARGGGGDLARGGGPTHRGGSGLMQGGGAPNRGWGNQSGGPIRGGFTGGQNRGGGGPARGFTGGPIRGGGGPNRGNNSALIRGGSQPRGGGSVPVNSSTPKFRSLTLEQKLDKNIQKDSMMNKLKEIQREENCTCNIERFVSPYVNDSLVKLIRGEVICDIRDYLEDNVKCENCQVVGHVTSLYDQQTRCGRCFHIHDDATTCMCAHTKRFLEWCMERFKLYKC